MKFRKLVEFVIQTKEKFQKSKLSIFRPLQKGRGGTNKLPHSLQKAEKSHPQQSEKKHAKFEKVVKSSVQPS